MDVIATEAKQTRRTRSVIASIGRHCERSEATSSQIKLLFIASEAKQTRRTEITYHFETSVSHKSFHSGFILSIKLILFFLEPPLIRFSSAIASSIVLNVL
jgi:hypothetical protein